MGNKVGTWPGDKCPALFRFTSLVLVLLIQLQPQIIVKDSARQAAGRNGQRQRVCPGFHQLRVKPEIVLHPAAPTPSWLTVPGHLQVFILEPNQVAEAFHHARGDDAVVERMGIFNFRNGGTADGGVARSIAGNSKVNATTAGF